MRSKCWRNESFNRKTFFASVKSALSRGQLMDSSQELN
jgi:hypothetical protein